MKENNPAEIGNIIYERDLYYKIKPYFYSKEIIAVLGSRQSGKTTLLNIIFQEISKSKKCVFLTFEKKDDLEIFDSDIENFKKLYTEKYEMIFIDEFQYAKDAGQKLKYLYDTTNTKFFISGSSSLEIKEAGKYLVGRVFTFYLYPMSFSEFVRAKNFELYKIILPAFEFTHSLVLGKKIEMFSDPIRSELLKKDLKKIFFDYLLFGGYPRTVLSNNEEEKKLSLSSILDNYLLREIRSLLKLATENKLLTLARFSALQTGSLISYQELSNASNLSYNETKKHINILRQTFIADTITPYFKNKRKELVKNPKLFFLDNGFRNKIINNFIPFETRTDAGALAENFIFSNLRYMENTEFSNIKFWRTKSQAEIDFILENQDRILPIEVKFAPLKNINIGKSMISFIKKYSPENAVVTTNNDFKKQFVLETNIYFIPIFYFGA